MDACYAELEAMLGELHAEARRVIAETPPLPRLVMMEPGEHYDGEYVGGTNVVRANPRVCGEPVALRRYLMAHELGHAVAWSVYGPQWSSSEFIANMYAARYYPRDVQQELLATWDLRCADQRPAACEKAVTWRWGMAH